MDAIWEGELEKGKNLLSSSSKDWRPMLFVLKRSSDVPMLYYYRDTKRRWQKQSPKGVVVLSPWIHISIAHECAYKFAFIVKHPEGTLYLAANNDGMMNTWIFHIQAQVTMSTKEGATYDVTAIPSDDMNKLRATGKLVLQLLHDEVKLASAGSFVMIASWPLSSLRRYSSENGVFEIEMGRRSPRGQGLYSFKTVNDGALFDKLQELIEKAAITPQNTLKKSKSSASKSVDSIAGATSQIDIDSRPPAPLPPNRQPPPPLPPKDNELDDVDSGGIRLKYDSITEAEIQKRRQASLVKTLQSQDETQPPYDVTQHSTDKIPDSDDHLYDVLKHDMGPTAKPIQPNLAAYDSVELKKDSSNSSIPSSTTYNIAHLEAHDDDGGTQPVTNPVYSLNVPSNPMYGTSADAVDVRKSLDNLAQELSDTAATLKRSRQEYKNEEDSSPPPPVPPQNFEPPDVKGENLRT